LLPDRIPFLVQCRNETGAKANPSAISILIYEEDNSEFSSSEIFPESNASKIGLAKIGIDKIYAYGIIKTNNKIGLYNLLIPKLLFSANKQYRVLWEVTVNGRETTKEEQFLMCNSSNFYG